MRTFIRMLYEGRDASDRCIKACANAHMENGVWVCPVFSYGVDKVSVVTEQGELCRRFKRKGDSWSG